MQATEIYCFTMHNINKFLYTISVLVVTLFCFSVKLSAQELTGSAKSEVVQKINQAAMKVKSIDCQFTQTKQSAMLQQAAEMEGVMHYRAPRQMRWEYTKPEKQSFIVRGDSVFVEKAGQRQVANNRMMKGITSMVMGCITGQQLLDEKNFRTVLYDDGSCYRAELTPMRKDMKRMFSQMELLFDKKDYSVMEVRLQEKQAGCTSIRFRSVNIH